MTACTQHRHGPPRHPPIGVLLSLVVVFVALMAGVLTGGAVVRWDLQTRAWMLAHHPSGLVSASTTVTKAGSPYISAVVLLGVAVAVSRRRRSPAPLALTALVLSVLIASVTGLKALVGRPGPALVHHQVRTGYFPSGHTTSAFVCYGLVALLLTHRASHGRCLWTFGSGLAAAAVVGTAMVYSNFHWLSDVLAGAALGGILTWGTVAVAASTTVLGGRGDHGEPRAILRPLQRVLTEDSTASVTVRPPRHPEEERDDVSRAGGGAGRQALRHPALGEGLT